MKYLFTFLFLVIVAHARCQTYNYYNIDGQGSWRSIIIMVPPGAAPTDKATTMSFFNSSTSDKIEPLVTVKQMKQDTITASYATIGSATEQYIIITPASKKYIIMSDSRQLFKTIYMLDGNLFNPLSPAVKKAAPINTDNVNRLLKVAVKILQ